MRWCVAYTQPMRETLAEQHLLAQGFDAYLPRIPKTRRHARKEERVKAPLFPRYIFVGVDLEKDPWRSINGTRGVSHLILWDERTPAEIPGTVIEGLKSRERDDGTVSIEALCLFDKGDKVRVLEGALQDQGAIFEGVDDKGRAQLLMNFLGRDVKVALPMDVLDTF